jgi:hypothetical protein
MPDRAALIVDGFNLYHSVHDLGENFLKWVNLWKLGEVIIPSNSEFVECVTFCTAFYPGDFQKRIRHDLYNAALDLVGVKIEKGYYRWEPRECPDCGHNWERPTEKQTDINVALAAFDGARRDKFDHCYILSADSDQAATVRWFKEAFPEKRLTMVVPPARKGSKLIRDKGEKSKIQLNRDHLERALFGAVVSNGIQAVHRPPEYDPPPGYVMWDDRPKR